MQKVKEDTLFEKKTVEGILKDINDIDIKDWVLKHHPGPEGSVLQVCPLWDNYYRINYWDVVTTKRSLREKRIVYSKFIKYPDTEFSII